MKAKPAGYWTEERIRLEASKHNRRIDFKKSVPSAYARALKMGILDQVCQHMQKDNFKFSIDEALKIAYSYKFLVDFRIEHPAAYKRLKNSGIIDSLKENHFKKKSQQKYTDKYIKEVAKKYNALDDFISKEKKLCRIAKSRKIYTEIIKHMSVSDELLKKQGIYWTEGRIRKEALKYDRKVDFNIKSPGASGAAVKLGIYDDVTDHMRVVGHKYKRAIYSFEFPDKTVYVGLTNDYDRRYQEHINGNSKLSKKTSEMDHYFVTFNEWLPAKEASKEEDRVLKDYLSKGWKTLNTQRPGNLGKTHFLTKDFVKNEIDKYEYFEDLFSCSKSAYLKIKKFGLSDYANKKLKRRKKNYKHYSKKEVLDISKKYSKVSDFKKESFSAYRAAIELNILTKATKHMKEITPPGFWTKERVKEIVERERTLNKIREFIPSPNKLIKKYNLGHLVEKERINHMSFSEEYLESLSKKFKHRTEFSNSYPKEYSAARSRGLLDKICSHMEKPTPKGREISFRGVRYSSISQLSKNFNKKNSKVRSRLNNGWTISQALDLSPPPKRKAPHNAISIEYKGKTYSSIQELSNKLGMNRDFVSDKIKEGYSIDEILSLKRKRK